MMRACALVVWLAPVVGGAGRLGVAPRRRGAAQRRRAAALTNCLGGENVGSSLFGSPLERSAWPAREVHATGEARDRDVLWAELRHQVSANDARLLLRTSALDLAVRDDCIIFDFAVLKGYLDRDKCVLLRTSANHDHHIHSIETAARKRSAEQEPANFALLMLECVLEEAYAHASRAFRSLDCGIRFELARLAELRGAEASRLGTLCRLLPLETALQKEAVRGRRVCALILDAIKNECEPNAPDLSPIVQEMDANVAEDVFENYLCRWEDLNDAIEHTSATIDATRKLLELALDNERNRIERMELYLSIGSLSFALCAAVSGFFGMNLLSGLEDHPGIFSRTIAITLTVASFLSFVVWQRFHLGQVTQLQQQSQGLASILKRQLTPQKSPSFM